MHERGWRDCSQQFGEHKDPIYKGRIDLVTKTDLAVEAFARRFT